MTPSNDPMSLKPHKILVLIASSLLATSCGSFALKSKTASNENLESVADIKKRIWQQTPQDKASELKTVIDFRIKDHVPIGRPASILISSNDGLYIDDNTNGKLFKISSNFQSVKELGTNKLTNPTRIRENNNNIFVYDNTGINIYDKEGQYINTIKPYLKVEDFDLLNEQQYVASLAELRLDFDPNPLAILDSLGKRVDSVGTAHQSDFVDIENRAFLEVLDGKVYVCYKYNPSFEIYDLKSKKLLQSVDIKASIFPRLTELKQDKKFVNPEPGKFKIPKFIAGFKIAHDKIYVLLHTPNPEIVEFALDGKEIQRYISNETQALDYFGFDVQLDNNAKQFFVGAIDGSSNPSIMVYEINFP